MSRLAQTGMLDVVAGEQPIIRELSRYGGRLCNSHGAPVEERHSFGEGCSGTTVTYTLSYHRLRREVNAQFDGGRERTGVPRVIDQVTLCPGDNDPHLGGSTEEPCAAPPDGEAEWAWPAS